ncbi:hypothetical protein E1B28_012274 [Marasmius oreades]|uniref:Uncharacterized protein n=1 Tax=Marasmius oreades TaxID=181124 RepID=A0A9P7RRA2_9AGAR|nr:uncharacterized protein E1B28_012274 [Marasmius oreades]KAG7088260.1 hypothetical protein E1B28_012274 [Marasmius oreades]
MSNYARLLQHLHQRERILPLETIQAALSHHLANVQPLPTPLVATAITSNLFFATPFTLPPLQSLQVSLRHALHLKYALLDKPKALNPSIFSPSIRSQMNQWVSDLMKGLQGGHAVMRLTTGTGVLLGLEDLRNSRDLELGIRRTVEDEIVVAFAEIMDLYKHELNEDSQDQASIAGWEREFQGSETASEISTITLCLVLACHSLPFIPPKKLQTLPLARLSRILTLSVTSAFREGNFLEEESRNGSGSSALVFDVIAPLSKLTSLTLALLIDLRASEGIDVAASVEEKLCQVCARVESNIQNILEHSAARDSWQVLKTLLFSCVMITEALLSSSLYIPRSVYSSATTVNSNGIKLVTPATLALYTLRILGHLSHVVHQFGGVTSMGVPTEDGSAGGVFKEMRKTFYLALDILTATAAEETQTQSLLEEFVKDFCQAVKVHDSPSTSSSPIPVHLERNQLLSKTSYTFACIEQLVPVLSTVCLSGDVWSILEPHLHLPESDPDTLKSLRETYEAAHSVVLAVFDTNANSYDGNVNHRSELSTFAEHLVPFYVKCLIENSHEGQLSTVQLCMAFKALLRSAACSQTERDGYADQPVNYTLAWFCISAIVEAQKVLEAELASEYRALQSDGGSLSGKTSALLKEMRLHRLRMVMIAGLSAVPHTLLAEFLTELKRTVLNHAERAGPEVVLHTPDTRKGKGKGKEEEQREAPVEISTMLAMPKSSTDEKKEELLQALYLEATERVGDREKEFVISWWYDNLDLLGCELGSYKKGEVRSEPLAGRIAGNESATALARL